MAIIKPDSSGHWYEIGAPLGFSYTAVPAYDKNLRDHRKNPSLLPSVTTVDKEKANFQLQAWTQEQVLMAACTLPEIPGESMDDRIKRIVEDSKAHGSQAAATGDIFHALIKRYLKGEKPDMSVYPGVIVDGLFKVMTYMEDHVAVTEYVEQGFASPVFGYACRIDWSGYLDGVRTMVDFKTQGTKADKKINVYDSWARQLAANAMAMPHEIKRWINIVVSTTEPGRIEVHEWPEDEIRRQWKVFYHLLQVFTISRKMGSWDEEKMQYIN